MSTRKDPMPLATLPGLTRRGIAILATALLALMLAEVAGAQARVTVTGDAVVGAKLTAKVTGGTARAFTWQTCAVKPNGRSCPAASLSTLGSRRTQTIGAAATGGYIRARATIRRANGRTAAATSAWLGPIAAQGGGGGGAGGARVGLYYCPPWGNAGISYTAIVSASEYKSLSSTGGYTLVDGASQPGGKVFQYSGGSYADGWINEYYPEGTLDGLGTPTTVPHIRLGLDPAQMSDRGYGWWCEWTQADPTFPPGW